MVPRHKFLHFFVRGIHLTVNYFFYLRSLTRSRSVLKKKKIITKIGFNYNVIFQLYLKY